MSPQRRTYWAVWIANLVAALGMMSFLPFFSSIVEELGVETREGKALWTGLCFGAAPLMAGLMGPFWGAFGDRYGRKLMVLRSLLALCVFIGLMRFAQTPVQLLLLRLGQGIFSGFLPPSITLVSIGVPKERQGRVAGDLQMAMAAGAIIGPLLGGWIAAAYGVRAIFTLTASLTGIGTAFVWLFAVEQRTEAERSAPAGPPGLGPVLQGLARDLAELLSNARTRAALVILFVVQFGIGATNPQMELFVRDLNPDFLGLSLENLTGLIFTTMAVTNLVVMPLWGRYGDRRGHHWALLVAAAGTAIALFANALAPVYLALLGTRVMLSSFGAAMGPCAFALAAEEAPEHRRGASFGAVFSVRTFSMAIAAASGGALSGLLGIRGLFAACGAGVLLALLWSARERRNARRAAAAV